MLLPEFGYWNKFWCKFEWLQRFKKKKLLYLVICFTIQINIVRHVSNSKCNINNG